MSRKDIELHKKAFELNTQGLSLAEISSSLGISPNTLKYWRSSKCKCACAFHGWAEFRKKLQVQVPQTIINNLADELRPKLTARQMVITLEDICSEALNGPDGLRPKSWKELLATFQLIVDLRRSYGLTESDDDGDTLSISGEISETRTIKGKVELHQMIDSFMKSAEEKAKKPAAASAVELLIDQSKDGMG